MAKMYPMIGAMQMPAGFKYKEILRRGRPSHEKWDSFFIKHPPMAPSRWAKIFAPFDALDGFDERIRAKEEAYTERKELDEGEKEELNRKLCYLHTLTMNGRLARQNRPTVAITYFSPCTDRNSFAYGTGGLYETVSGICRKIDDVAGTITIGETVIPLDDITDVTGTLFGSIGDDIP
jgi:hypothetical protein